MAHGGQHASDQNGRQAGREDESRCIRPDHIDYPRIGGDISAHDAKRFAKRALDNSYPVCHAITFGDAAAMRAVHADRMHLVTICQGIIFVCQIANLRNRRHCAVHRIHAFKRDQFRDVGIIGRQ